MGKNSYSMGATEKDQQETSVDNGHLPSEASDGLSRFESVEVSVSNPSSETLYPDPDSYEVLEISDNCCTRCLVRYEKCCNAALYEHPKILKGVLGTVFLLLYFAYFGYAMYYSFEDNIALLVLTVLGVLVLVYNLVKFFCGKKFTCDCELGKKGRKIWNIIRGVLFVLFLIGLIVYIVVDVRTEPYRLVSLFGLVAYLFLCFIFSKHPARVPWDVVLSGLVLQFCLAWLILLWRPGFIAFEWLGDQLTIFLGYTNAGAIFVFGEDFPGNSFAFRIMPTVIFFGATVGLLYYSGIMQVFIRAFGRLMEWIMNIGPIEAFMSAANVFLGGNVAVLCVGPFLKAMTLSELFSAMVSSYSTSTGALFGVYALFGVPMNHIIAASVISAPAALVIAKILWPEDRKSAVRYVKNVKFDKGPAVNMLDAFSRGASQAVSLVVAIVASVIAFVALVEFLNVTLVWLGMRVGIEGLTFMKACSYLLYPLAWLMGVRSEDCLQVAELIGTKLFMTDILGYRDLGILIKKRLGGAPPMAVLSPRSEVIAAYALCGLGNIPNIGVLIGGFGGIEPRRWSDYAKLVFRAMIAGNLACFITACLAGLMVAEDATV